LKSGGLAGSQEGVGRELGDSQKKDRRNGRGQEAWKSGGPAGSQEGVRRELGRSREDDSWAGGSQEVVRRKTV
jgi:hypothetical protein